MHGISSVHSIESTKEEKEIKKDDFRLERNEARIVKWMNNDRSETGFQLKNLQKCGIA